MHLKKEFKYSDALWGTVFLVLLLVTYQIYLPGTHGVFIFDDLPNLSPLGRYTNFSLWDNFRLFILEGSSGPTGRPISLASFYLNDVSWPSLPSGFIRTNILIHLLNGVLVYWFSLKLSNTLELSKNVKTFFALIITAFWLLHPMHTTTVLYIIQRMTELSATFMLAGLIFYLSGREQLKDNLKKGFSILFLGIGLSLIFAVFSKENGILLVAYILVVEFFLLQPLHSKPPRYFYYWLTPAVVAPFITIIIYLGLHTNPENFANRNFTLSERLLTEPRILFDYIHHILIPDMADITLFHDDFIISKSLLSPWTTLPSIVGLLLLSTIAFILRIKAPVIGFAIAWFFVGHLIESTVLPLELYFEHRNYLPLLGIGVVISWYTSRFLISKKYKIITTILICILLALNASITFQNTKQWGKPLELSINWYHSHPQSERMRQLYLSLTKLYNTKPDMIHNQETNQLNEDSMFYVTTVMLNLADTCLANDVSPSILESVVHEIKTHSIHATSSIALTDFFKNWQAGKCDTLSTKDIESFLLKLSTLNKVKNVGVLAHNIHLSLSELYRAQKDLSNTMIHLDKAYVYHPTYVLLELRAATLSSAGLNEEALDVLDDTRLLKRNIRERLALTIQQKELNQLKQIIRKKK